MDKFEMGVWFFSGGNVKEIGCCISKTIFDFDIDRMDKEIPPEFHKDRFDLPNHQDCKKKKERTQ